mgnify:CR=1 FL=1|tara:strand:- start:8393 stop:8644 length:252 start_codon:yes stop_codon:yes gene_type:complete
MKNQLERRDLSTRLSDEHHRLAMLATYAHAMLDALEILSVADLLEARAEAAAMTPAEIVELEAEVAEIQAEFDRADAAAGLAA